MEKQFDVVVVGAGAAGMLAALELALSGRTVAVVEARDRIGGRAFTIADSLFELPVEMGAEFIHGNLPVTFELLKKAGITAYPVEGSFLSKKNGAFEKQGDAIAGYQELVRLMNELSEDISVADFIQKYLQDDDKAEIRQTVTNYVEGYYSGYLFNASCFALRKELQEADDEQYRIEGGYGPLFNYLYEECLNHSVRFFLSHPVTRIEHGDHECIVRSSTANFIARQVLVAIPLGNWQHGDIEFRPALGEKQASAKQLGNGHVVKTILQFDEAFWKEHEEKSVRNFGFVFSNESIPTWWSYEPKQVAMITGWSGGPHADRLQDLTSKEIIDLGLASLSNIFGITEDVLRSGLVSARVGRWPTDEYTRGGYSYDVVNGEHHKAILAAPVNRQIYVTGEALFSGPKIGTVEAAFHQGRETARQMIAGIRS